MRYMRLILTLSALALASPALAGDMFDSVFAHADGGRPCYARLYDAAHLRQHARQTVSWIEINFEPRNADGVLNLAGKFELGFGFALSGSREAYTNVAYCSTMRGYFDCSLESDGGLFHLTPQNGALRLDVVNRGGTDASGDQINVEGENGFAGFGKPAGDDLVFILPRAAHSVCDAATPGEQ